MLNLWCAHWLITNTCLQPGSLLISHAVQQEYFLGSGGVFGLLTALVGESLPGSGPCIAVGNALMQGPVIYHMPQSLVNAIKDRSEQGDAYMKQLELDLYR